MRTVGLLLIAALLFPSPALSQPSETQWLVGRWDGSIANYPGAGSPARTFEVTKVDSDGRAEALWYITGQRTAPAQVTVTASSVKVITVAKSRVDLTRDGESLVGTFVLSDGRSFAIKMVKSVSSARPANPDPQLKSIVGKWNGTGHSSVGTNPLEWTIKDDGTVEVVVVTPSGSRSGLGKLSIKDGKLFYQSGTSSGPVTLQEDGGHRVLKYDAVFTNNTRGGAELRPAK